MQIIDTLLSSGLWDMTVPPFFMGLFVAKEWSSGLLHNPLQLQLYSVGVLLAWRWVMSLLTTLTLVRGQDRLSSWPTVSFPPGIFPSFCLVWAMHTGMTRGQNSHWLILYIHNISQRFGYTFKFNFEKKIYIYIFFIFIT